MQRYDQSANYCMIYAAQVPWRSSIQALSGNHKTSGEKCYKLDWNSDPSNAAPEWQAGRIGARGELAAACPLEGLVRCAASPQTTSANLHIYYCIYTNHGLANGIICLPWQGRYRSRDRW
jgi:hypothetical protein